MSITTIQIQEETLEELKNLRKYKRQTYNELINNLIKLFKEAKTANQYDEFLHKVQQKKMRELWDNDEDEEWEKA